MGKRSGNVEVNKLLSHSGKDLTKPYDTANYRNKHFVELVII